MGLLQQLGYLNVRHVRGGLAAWTAAGGPLGRLAASGLTEEALAAGHPVRVRTHAGRMPAHRWRITTVFAVLERWSTAQLLWLWVTLIVLCGGVYWLAGLASGPTLLEGGTPVAFTARGLATAFYFSFVTAMSVGYGDVVPVGVFRLLAVAEAAAGLLVFGVLVSKLVSQRQEELVGEIHRLTFEERLRRVQTNLHLVRAELQSIVALCADRPEGTGRIATHLESAAMVFAGELRAIHDLLYRPQHLPEEAALEAILASLAGALRELHELLACLPAHLAPSPTLTAVLHRMARLAEDICGDCVPREYAPALREWMDRVQETARTLAAE